PFRVAAAALLVVEALGYRDLEAPGDARLPMCVLEIVAGRAHDVGYVVPDVALAVAVEVDGIVDHVGRHELRLPHGAGPGADHLLAREMVLLHEAHRDDELVAEIGRAILDVSKRRQ